MWHPQFHLRVVTGHAPIWTTVVLTATEPRWFSPHNGPRWFIMMGNPMNEAQLKIRLPPELKEWLAASADKNCRTISNEVVFRLKEAKAMEEKSSQKSQ
ncbi:protein of unknown function (plasmid) [Rhodovastum atsumiense]|nr:protein of unknown function [Rhodovastum atsumiense]